MLNAISVVNIVLAAGILTEFCVYFTSTFQKCKYQSLNDKAIYALGQVGGMMLQGFTVTKIIAVVTLLWSSSELFIVYYMRMFLIITVVGVLHGMVVVPVILTLMPARLFWTRHSIAARTSRRNDKWRFKKKKNAVLFISYLKNLFPF